jgi:hypothetical protein
VTLAGVSFVAHRLVAGNDGYFRDELYYIADGWHLQPGYVDQPLLMGWLAVLLRVIAGDNLVAIHIIPALACALIIVVTGRMARELGGGRVAQLVAGVAALFTLDFMATGSILSMDILDQLWWALASLIVVRLLRQNAPRLWLLVRLFVAIAVLTKLTVLFCCLALALAVLVTPERRYLRPLATIGGCHRRPEPAAVPHPECPQRLAHLGVLAPLWRRRHQPGGLLRRVVRTDESDRRPLAAAGLVSYFHHTGVRYRPLGWAFVFVYLVLTLLGTKPYFLAPAYPIPFAVGAVVFERWALRPRLAWLRPAYVVLLAIAGILLAPDVMSILPPATAMQIYRALPQALGDRFGWDSLTETVEQVYAGLPSAQRAPACVLTSNDGTAGALSQLAAPGRLPPVTNGHNDYLWGPGTCTGEVLIAVGYSPSNVQGAPARYAHITLAAIQRCQYCVADENNLPIAVLSSSMSSIFSPLWSSLKHYD